MAAAKQIDAVVIFGSGRSGTTWVQDALAEANQYCTVFEPLHPDEVRGASEFANQYIQPGSSNPELHALMHIVLTERIAPIWTRMRVRRNRLLPRVEHGSFIRALRNLRVTYARLLKRWLEDRRMRQRPQIVKFIRGNLLAEWLVAEFGVRGAVVVRHPCAVLASVIRRTGSEWSIDAMRAILDRYLRQRELVSTRLDGVAASLAELSSFAGIQTAIWCIENAHFINDDATDSLHVSFYEDLVCNRANAWTRLTTTLGLEHEPDERLLLKPSQQAGYPLLKQFSTDRLIAGWQERLNAEQMDEVAMVLSLFGVSAYNTDDPMPVGSTTPATTTPNSLTTNG